MKRQEVIGCAEQIIAKHGRVSEAVPCGFGQWRGLHLAAPRCRADPAGPAAHLTCGPDLLGNLSHLHRWLKGQGHACNCVHHAEQLWE
jgi:hypothetical protein